MHSRTAVVACCWCGVAFGQVVQEAKVIPQQVGAGDIFGYALAFDGETVAVGAPFDDAPNRNTGVIYALARIGGEWVSTSRIAAGDPQADAAMGSSMAVDGGVIVAGASGHSLLGDTAGALYIFEGSGVEWSETARLFGSDTQAEDGFGSVVAVDGTTVLGVSKYHPTGRGGFGVGYIFEPGGSGWEQVQRIEPVNSPFDQTALGPDAEIDGDLMVIGGRFSQPSSITGAGAAYVFERSGGVWTHAATLTAPQLQADEHFGAAVALSQDLIVIGGSGYDGGGKTDGGAVYTFVRDGAGWAFEGRMIPDDNLSGDIFGVAVEIDGPVLAVGAYLADDHGDDGGKVYLYDRVGGAWELREQFAGDDTNEGDLFGWSLGLAGGRVAVAAPFENTRGLQAGAAYVFAGAAAGCVGDFNGDGLVDTRDVIAFLSAWAAGEDAADIDGNGLVDTRDVIAFLSAWAGGC